MAEALPLIRGLTISHHKTPRVCVPDLRSKAWTDRGATSGHRELVIVCAVLENKKTGFFLLRRPGGLSEDPTASKQIEPCKKDGRWVKLTATLDSSAMESDTWSAPTMRWIFLAQPELKNGEWVIGRLQRYLKAPTKDLVAIADDLSLM